MNTDVSNYLRKEISQFTYGSSQIRSDSSSSDDSRVGAGVRATDTLEVLDGLGNSLVIIAISIQAVVNLAHKGRVRAVARGVRVVDTAHDEVPGADAGGDDGGAGQGLGRGGGRGHAGAGADGGSGDASRDAGGDANGDAC